MRPLDAAECRAMGVPPRVAVALGLAGSIEPVVAAGLHGPLCAFGITPYSLMDGIARPWLLGTTGIGEGWRELLRAPGAYLEAWRRDFPILENWVMAANAPAVRWLAWHGFVIEPEAVQIGTAPFRRFTMGL